MDDYKLNTIIPLQMRKYNRNRSYSKLKNDKIIPKVI